MDFLKNFEEIDALTIDAIIMDFRKKKCFLGTEGGIIMNILKNFSEGQSTNGIVENLVFLVPNGLYIRCQNIYFWQTFKTIIMDFFPEFFWGIIDATIIMAFFNEFFWGIIVTMVSLKNCWGAIEPIIMDFFQIFSEGSSKLKSWIF